MKLTELQLFLLFILVLWILWAVSGGPKRAEQENAPFIKQPAPIESGETYRTIQPAR